MAGIDMSRVKNIESEIGGDSILAYANKIQGEADGRILPPTEKMGGLYFAERKIWWINKKPYLSNATFGEDDVIQHEIDLAKASKDPDILDLISDADKLAMKPDYLIPWLELQCTFDSSGAATNVKVVGGKGKLLVVGSMLLKSINKQVTSRYTQPDISDRKVGFNLLVSKTGAGMKTEYSAEAWRQPYEMPETYYASYPCPVEYLEGEKLNDNYLRGVIRNYIYGERMPDEATKKATSTAQASGRGGAARGEAARPESTRRGPVEDEPRQEIRRAVQEEAPVQDEPIHETKIEPKAETPKPAAAAPTATEGNRRRRNLLEDIKE